MNPNQDQNDRQSSDYLNRAYLRGCHQAIAVAKDWLLDHPGEDPLRLLDRLERMLAEMRDTNFQGPVLDEAKQRLKT